MVYLKPVHCAHIHTPAFTPRGNTFTGMYLGGGRNPEEPRANTENMQNSTQAVTRAQD